LCFSAFLRPAGKSLAAASVSACPRAGRDERFALNLPQIKKGLGVQPVSGGVNAGHTGLLYHIRRMWYNCPSLALTRRGGPKGHQEYNNHFAVIIPHFQANEKQNSCLATALVRGRREWYNQTGRDMPPGKPRNFSR
jgi:hypothetical protein